MHALRALLLARSSLGSTVQPTSWSLPTVSRHGSRHRGRQPVPVAQLAPALPPTSLPLDLALPGSRQLASLGHPLRRPPDSRRPGWHGRVRRQLLAPRRKGRAWPDWLRQRNGLGGCRRRCEACDGRRRHKVRSVCREGKSLVALPAFAHQRNRCPPRRICIWSPGLDATLNTDGSNVMSPVPGYGLAETIATGHRGNIFSLKWAPGLSTRLFSCAADAQVRVFDLSLANNPKLNPETVTPPADSPHRPWVHHDEGTATTHVLRCHTDRVKRIATEASSDVFLTCAEDGTVRCVERGVCGSSSARHSRPCPRSGSTTSERTTCAAATASTNPTSRRVRRPSPRTVRASHSTRSRSASSGRTSLSSRARLRTPTSVRLSSNLPLPRPGAARTDASLATVRQTTAACCAPQCSATGTSPPRHSRPPRP